MKIPLRNFHKNIVDWATASIEDYNLLKQYTFCRWMQKNKIYAKSNKNTSMHEIVTGQKAPKGYKIDHRDGNGLNNRRENLRIVTNGVNGHNKSKKKGSSSKYNGVTLIKKKKKWNASIGNVKKYSHLYSKTIHIGNYTEEIEAAKAYDSWALYLYGEYARFNVDDNDNPLLTENEREYILKNGLPEKYKKTKKKRRDLPKNVYTQSNGNYYYGVSIKGKLYTKGGFKTVNEAKNALGIRVEEITAQHQIDFENRKKNISRNPDGIAIIFLSTGEEILLDDDVWKDIFHIKWSKSGDYAKASINGETITMHIHIYVNYIGPIPEGMTVDHINLTKSDNRLCNLRPLTQRDQNHNQRKQRNSILKYKGVSVTGTGKFRGYNGKSYKTFNTEEEAALYYNDYAIKTFRETACLNNITTINTTMDKYFSDKTITLDFIKNIQKICDLKEVFIAKPNWVREFNIPTPYINSNDFQKYKDLAITLIERDSDVKKIMRW